MARKMRLEYKGAIWHPRSFYFGATSVMTRDDRREPIFQDHTGYIRLCAFQGWQIQYSLSMCPIYFAAAV